MRDPGGAQMQRPAQRRSPVDGAEEGSHKTDGCDEDTKRDVALREADAPCTIDAGHRARRDSRDTRRPSVASGRGAGRSSAEAGSPAALDSGEFNVADEHHSRLLSARHSAVETPRANAAAPAGGVESTLGAEMRLAGGEKATLPFWEVGLPHAGAINSSLGVGGGRYESEDFDDWGKGAVMWAVPDTPNGERRGRYDTDWPITDEGRGDPTDKAGNTACGGYMEEANGKRDNLRNTEHQSTLTSQASPSPVYKAPLIHSSSIPPSPGLMHGKENIGQSTDTNMEQQINQTHVLPHDEPTPQAQNNQGNTVQHVVLCIGSPGACTERPEADLPDMEAGYSALPATLIPMAPSDGQAESVGTDAPLLAQPCGIRTHDGVFRNLAARPEKMVLPEADLPPPYETPLHADADVFSAEAAARMSGGHTGAFEDVVLDGREVGTYLVFAVFFAVSMLFEWFGFVIAMCLAPSHAAHYGAIGGLGVTIALQTVTFHDIAKESVWWRAHAAYVSPVMFVIGFVGYVVLLYGLFAYHRCRLDAQEYVAPRSGGAPEAADAQPRDSPPPAVSSPTAIDEYA